MKVAVPIAQLPDGRVLCRVTRVNPKKAKALKRSGVLSPYAVCTAAGVKPHTPKMRRCVKKVVAKNPLKRSEARYLIDNARLVYKAAKKRHELGRRERALLSAGEALGLLRAAGRFAERKIDSITASRIRLDVDDFLRDIEVKENPRRKRRKRVPISATRKTRARKNPIAGELVKGKLKKDVFLKSPMLAYPTGISTHMTVTGYEHGKKKWKKRAQVIRVEDLARNPSKKSRRIRVRTNPISQAERIMRDFHGGVRQRVRIKIPKLPKTAYEVGKLEAVIYKPPKGSAIGPMPRIHRFGRPNPRLIGFTNKSPWMILGGKARFTDRGFEG